MQSQAVRQGWLEHKLWEAVLGATEWILTVVNPLLEGRVALPRAIPDVHCVSGVLRGVSRVHGVPGVLRRVPGVNGIARILVAGASRVHRVVSDGRNVVQLVGGLGAGGDATVLRLRVRPEGLVVVSAVRQASTTAAATTTTALTSTAATSSLHFPVPFHFLLQEDFKNSLNMAWHNKADCK